MKRGDFLRRLGGFALLPLIDRSSIVRALARGPLAHPDPRPGITSEHVLTPAQIGKKKNVIDAFDAARTYPQIFDGIACGCGCDKEHRSLLVCFETAQPTGCQACRGEALLVGRLAKAGKALDEIRQAVDKDYS